MARDPKGRKERRNLLVHEEGPRLGRNCGRGKWNPKERRGRLLLRGGHKKLTTHTANI